MTYILYIDGPNQIVEYSDYKDALEEANLINYLQFDQLLKTDPEKRTDMPRVLAVVMSKVLYESKKEAGQL